MKTARCLLSAIAAVSLVCTASSLLAEEDFPLRDGDTWVMAGDSITAQHLHSNYFEAFCFARYQDITFRFRNSGVGGDTVPRVLARFDWDVAGWKPTVVSVELGMNDQGGYSTSQFIANMGQLDARIRSAGARPVYFTSSPINNGDTLDDPGRNGKLGQFADALEKFAAEKDAPFADQFHDLIDIWGRNKPSEQLADLISRANSVVADPNLAGAEHLRNFLAEQNKLDKQPVSLMGDPVHPGAPGQLTMAAALLDELNAGGEVSSVTLDATGKVVDSDGCTIDNPTEKDGVISFNRIDERLPFPIPADARNVLPLFPKILDLSEYMLTVTGLPAGSYELRVDGKPVGKVSNDDLSDGVNLTEFATGPIAEQGQAILAAVSAKEGLVSQWRNLSKANASGDAPDNAKHLLATVAKSVDDADQKIRDAAKPKWRKFELRPAK